MLVLQAFNVKQITMYKVHKVLQIFYALSLLFSSVSPSDI